jgi:AcrR family transcriptional regulator
VARSDSEAREKIIAIADRLFSERGYKAVMLTEIAAEVGVRHPSLYHHFPKGKEQLYVEVMERNLNHHQLGLERSIIGAQPEIRSQLLAAAEWFLSQPPMDLMRLIHSDMPAIDAAAARRLVDLSYVALMLPIKTILEEALRRGEIAESRLDVLAGSIVGMIEQLYAVPGASHSDRLEMAHFLIDSLLNGLYRN